jgi:hypothetical protein
VDGHARSAHVQDRSDQVDRAQDRAHAGNVQRENGEVHRRTRVTRGRERRVDGPAATKTGRACSAFKEEAHQQQDERHRQQPEGNVVDTREGRIRRAHHQGSKIVGKATHGRRHDHEEHHDQGVGRREDVEHLFAGVDGRVAVNTIDHGCEAVENLDARLLQLHAHEAREQTTDDAGDDREHQVHDPDVFVVGRQNPAPPAGRRVVVVGGMAMPGGLSLEVCCL